MNITEGDLHDSCVATYQTLDLARLNDTLAECGITDPAKRREICERYFFDSGYFLDSCYFEERGRYFRPGVYFAEVSPDGKPKDTVLMPDPSFGTAFHEYAHGAVAWLYDDHAENASAIRTGDVNSQ